MQPDSLPSPTDKPTVSIQPKSSVPPSGAAAKGEAAPALSQPEAIQTDAVDGSKSHYPVIGAGFTDHVGSTPPDISLRRSAVPASAPAAEPQRLPPTTSAP